MALNSRSSSLQLPNAGVANMPPPFLCVVGDQTHSRQTLCPLSPSPEKDPLNTTHGLDTSRAFKSRAIFSFVVMYSYLSRSSFQKQRVLFPRNRTMRKVSLLLPACPAPRIPSTNGYWVPAPYQAPGRTPETQSYTSPPSIVVHSLRKRTEVSLVQLEKGKQDAP